MSVLRANGCFEVLKYTENVNSVCLGRVRNENDVRPQKCWTKE